MSTDLQEWPSQLPIPAGTRALPHSGRLEGRVGLARMAGPAHSLAAIPKVVLSDICLSYRTESGERLLALDHINLQVQPGEFVCVVGPSGCGKSTRCI